MEMVEDPDRFEWPHIGSLRQTAHGCPLVGRGNAGQIEPPALRYEHSESHPAILWGQCRASLPEDARRP